MNGLLSSIVVKLIVRHTLRRRLCFEYRTDNRVYDVTEWTATSEDSADSQLSLNGTKYLDSKHYTILGYCGPVT